MAEKKTTVKSEPASESAYEGERPQLEEGYEDAGQQQAADANEEQARLEKAAEKA